VDYEYQCIEAVTTIATTTCGIYSNCAGVNPILVVVTKCAIRNNNMTCSREIKNS